MIKREIPSSRELLPVIGLGTWIQFDVDAASGERNSLTEVLKLMADNGARLIDSSPMYGRSEAVVGELTSELNPENYFYATKVWTEGEKAGIVQMESSMKKMKRAQMDLMQVHNLVDYKTHLRTLRKWKEEGKVRYIGVTHYTISSHSAIEKILMEEEIDFVQFNYSLGVRNAEKSLLNTAAEKGAAVIINEPFEKGNLFRNVSGKNLPGWTKDFGIDSWSAFFLKYIISHPAVTCVIPGTSDPRHMRDILSAGEGILPNESERKKFLEVLG
jgi:diketogulonate reductase-like aldo/keto reductase